MHTAHLNDLKHTVFPRVRFWWQYVVCTKQARTVHRGLGHMHPKALGGGGEALRGTPVVVPDKTFTYF